MVYRKESNKTDHTQTIIKPCLQTHDGRCKTPDLKTKNMKKSRKTGNPSLLGSTPNAPTPTKKASLSSSPFSYGSPNYMKSTSNSDARKERKTKAPSSKHTRTGVNVCSKVVLCENVEVRRNTCSYTLKDSKFLMYLKLNPGATEAEGISAMKVCPYKYCSLNGHHHKPSPPLRCFLSSRRNVLKTHKIAEPEVDHNEDFFVAIHFPSEDPEENDQISYEVSCNGEDVDGDKYTSVSMDAFLGENSDMEWEEGQSNISDQKDEGCDQHKPEFKLDDIGEKLNSYFDEGIMEWECFSDANSVPESESKKPDEEQIEDPSEVEKEGTLCSGQKDETTDQGLGTISPNPDFQSIKGQENIFCERFDEIIEAGNEGPRSDQESVEIQSDKEFFEAQSDEESLEMQSEEAADNSAGGDTEVEEEEDNADTSKEERISTDGMIGEILPKIDDLDSSKEETPMASNNSEVEVNQNKYTELNQDSIAAPEREHIKKIEEPEAFTVVKDYEPHSKGNKFFNGESYSNEELLESCNKLKRWIRCKKENDDNEDRKFNRRDPNFLPLELDSEAEKVDLRHQDMDERRNAEEWMLDYALQKTLDQLAPVRNRKVALLVEAFEAVLPIPKSETRTRKNSPGFTHARTLQACS